MPLQPFYYDGLTFSAATNVYTDATLATPAPDGYYALGGIVRIKSGGVLGPPQACPSCAVPCGTGGFEAEGNQGIYSVDFELGNTPGAAIVTFSPGVSNTTCLPIPDRCTWTYNGITASEYSALVGGYQTGLIGAPDGPPKGGAQCNACGATGKPSVAGIDNFVYNPSSGVFDPSGTTTLPALTGVTNFVTQPEATLLDWNNSNPTAFANGTTPCGSGGTNFCTINTGIGMPVGFGGATPAAPNLPAGANWPLINREYRGATMVVPSPPGVSSTILSIVVDAPCGSTWWGITVECPRELSGFSASAVMAQGTDHATVCAASMSQTLYHVPVDAYGNSNRNSSYYVPGNEFPLSPKNGQPDGTLGYHDWIFTDPYGETPAPVGEYKIESPLGSGTFYHVSVGVREYRDVSNLTTGTCTSCNNNIKILPPEGYSGSYNGVAGVTQTSGPYVDGIVRSMIPC